VSPDALTDTIEADRNEKATIEYSFTMRVNGLSPAEIENFVADGWTIKPGGEDIFLYPREPDGIGGNADEYLHGVFSRHGKVFTAAAAIGTSREICLAIYFDANRIAAICPRFDAAILRRLADLNFTLVACVYPSSFEDDEGTEE
jgi:hypothetical protein